MKFIVPVLLSLLSFGCVSGTASDNVSATESMSFAGATQLAGLLPTTCQPGSPVFSTTQTTDFDISNPLQQLQKQGSLSVSFDTNTLSGNLTDFKHASIYIYNDGDTPELLTQTDFTPTNGVVNLAFTMDEGRIFQIVSAGKTNVEVELSACATSAPIDIQYTLGATVNFSFTKGI